ncbi:MAG TPA: GNAT family N-acetyltransferase [Rhizobium sp.]|nr:GNAT family N-acetyltransferase [Rhizobium sp.]
MVTLTLRKADKADIPFIMATERMPGYDRFLGSFEEAEHLRLIGDASWAYFVATDESGSSVGFAILNDLDNRDGNVCLKRLAMRDAGQGFGTAMLPALLSWIFEETSTHRFWLNVVNYNARGLSLYRRAGFVEEGVKRQSALLADGSRADLVMMSILRPEWETGNTGS